MKKLKGICLALLTVVLSVAMLMGTLSLSAFAASNITEVDGTAATFVKRVAYGEPTSAFKGATKVLTPNGTSLTDEELEANEYTPKQIGVYTVYYGDVYSYSVYCYLNGDYELRVDNNGADIATYMEAGGTLLLPKASVWCKTDDDDEYWEDKDTEVMISVTPSVSETFNTNANTNDNKVENMSVGTYTVHYYANVKGGTKYLFKDYTVKVQQKGSVNDTVSPQLTVVNVPTTLSLNNKVNLPKATATDNYDENVKVIVTVQVYDDSIQDYRNVRKVETDPKTGYAVKELEDNDAHSNDVVFDNEYNLSFYPTVKGGTYKITYQAFDDAGNYTTLATHTYTATCSDRTSPVLQEIDDSKIPTTWGLEVTRAATIGEKSNESVSTKTLEDTKITFPYPDYTDNNGTEDLTVSFKIEDTTNKKTVVYFANIYDTSDEGTGYKYTYKKDDSTNGIYNPDADSESVETPTELTFTKDGFEFDFNVYAKSLTAVDKDATATGSYTVTYQAKDSTPNIVTKTYDITLESSFSDTSAPSVEALTWQEGYLVFTGSEEEFTLPTPDISDNSDSNLAISYKLFDGNSADNFIEVDGGETAKLQLRTKYTDGEFAESGAKYPTLIVKGAKGEADKVLQFANGTLEYEIVATDDVGNKTVVGNGTRATADTDNYTVAKADKTVISIVNADTLATKTPSIDDSKINNTALDVGKKANVGSYEVTLSDADRKYYGFELSLYTTEDGVTSAWTTGKVELYTYYDNGTLYVTDITFAAPNVDSVTMFFRVYDVAGRSYTDSKTFTVNPADDEDGKDVESSLNIGTSGTVYTSYILKNTKASLPSDCSDHEYIVRKIQGAGKFSLTGGSLFTAYNAGTFTFTEYFELNTPKDGTKYKLVDTSGSYDWTATEKATPVWQVQDEMPVYTPLKKDGVSDGIVRLPHVVASTEFANAKIELTVSFAQAGGSTKSLEVAKDTSEEENKKPVKIGADGRYYFVAEQDGTYTVTYRATYGDNEHLEQTFTIKAGDITAPLFKVDTTPKATATENSRFKFSAITLESDEELSNTRFTKTLESPDGTTVFSVDGNGETYRKMEVQSGSDYTNGYKFTKTGVYTVRYKVTDKAGNESMTTYTITVSAAKVNNPVSTKIISTILIIVGVLLIAGVILYFVRFRKVKTDKVKK